MVSKEALLFSVVFKFIAMVIGVLGNTTVIIYSIFWTKEKTATSYLVGNLALADLLLCLTFYPIWIVEFIQTLLDIDSDQDFFCKLSRSTIWAFLFASVASLLAITVDRHFFIVKPLRYPLIVTQRRIFQAIFGIWLIACCIFVVLTVYYRPYVSNVRSFCFAISADFYLVKNIILMYVPLVLVFLLNFQILKVARKQRKRVMAETSAHTASNEHPSKKIISRRRFLFTSKATKTFSFVVMALALCVFIPTVVGAVLEHSDSVSFRQTWFLIFHYEFCGLNSIVNPFIYGIRHIKQRRAYASIIFNICPTTRS